MMGEKEFEALESIHPTLQNNQFPSQSQPQILLERKRLLYYFFV